MTSPRRSKLSWFLMLLALGILLSAGAAFARRSFSAKTAKSLEVAPASQQIIANAGEKSISTIYKIRNLGNHAVNLGNPTTTCGCSVASISPKTISPGDSAVIQVQGEPPPVGKKRVEIRLPTDAEDLPEVVLELVMIGPGKTPYVAFDSRSIAFGGLSRKDLPAKRDVMIMTRETAGRSPWVSRLESSVDGLSFEGGLKEEMDVGNQVVARTYRYRAVLSQGTSSGSIEGTLRVFGIDRASAILELPILGRFNETVVASPPVLYSSYASDEKPQPLKVIIFSNESDFDPNSVEPEDVPPSVRVRRLSNAQRSAIFEVDCENSGPDDLRATLSFRTSVPGSPKVVVPLILHRSSSTGSRSGPIKVSITN